MNRQGLVDFERSALIDDEHMADNLTAYKELQQQVYIVSHIWGYSNTSNESVRGDPVKTELFCLRANNVEGGAMRLGFAQSLWWFVLLGSGYMLELL